MAELLDFLAERTRFTHHFVQYLTAICSRPEATSDVISGGVIDPTGVKVRVELVILGQTVLEIYDTFTL